MIEDKLKREECIRLEALNQALQATAMHHSPSLEQKRADIISTAQEFERYIKNGDA